jgi:hypothetical protein
MIDSIVVNNVDGTHTCEINTYTYPLHDFDPQVTPRINISRKRSQQNGVWPTKSYRDTLQVHCEGDIFGSSSANYFANRQALLLALFGTPGSAADDLSNNHRKMGWLDVLFTGATEHWLLDYTISAFSAPLIGDSPSRSAFMVTFEGWQPWFIGATTSTAYQYA